ncbi:MAG: hypothetical protein GEU28_13230, partial [Dehalococcoidia bacterium]|nr:hypothetical protein [Dehalococcoidia bacterium]
MPNNVIRFVVNGPDLAALRQFYETVFGWTLYQVQPDFLVLETYPHSHDESGNDINPPVVLDVSH